MLASLGVAAPYRGGSAPRAAAGGGVRHPDRGPAQALERAAARPLSVAAYRARLRMWGRAVAGLGSAQEAAQLARRLPRTWPVAVGPVGRDGAILPISTRWLRKGLGRIALGKTPLAAGRRRLSAALRRREILAAAALPRAVLAARRRTLQAILSAREFRAAQEQSAAAELWRRIARWLGAVLHQAFGRAAGTDAGSWVVIALIVLAVAAGLLWLGRWAWRRWRRQEVAAAVYEQERSDAAALLARARREAGAGAGAAAALCAYQAGLAYGAEAGWWQLAAARTPREYLQSLPAGHPACFHWRELTRDFEAWRYAAAMPAAAAAAAMFDALEGMGCR